PSPVADAPATLTPLGISGSFDTADKVYDGTTAAAASNRQLSGVLGSDDVHLSGGTATFNTKTVDTHKPVSLAGASLTGTDSGNYSLTSVADAHANITPLGISGSFDSADKVYDGTTAAAASNRQLSGVLGSDDVHLSGGTATFNTKTVDTHKPVTLAGASLTGTDSGNHS